MAENDNFQFIAHQVCELNNDFIVNVFSLPNAVFVLELEGVLDGKIDLKCKNKFSEFIELNAKSQKICFIIRFNSLKTNDLEISVLFFDALVHTANLNSVYLIGFNQTFRLAVKLVTSHNIEIPVYWLDSVRSALHAIERPYYSSAEIENPQSIFGQNKLHIRFMELWDGCRKLWLINNEKVRVLAFPEWHYQSDNADFLAKFTIIEDRILHIKFIGKISIHVIDAIRRKQEQIYAELEMDRMDFYNMFDISEIDVRISEMLKFFFITRAPLLLGSGYVFIGARKSQSFLLKLSKYIGSTERKDTVFFRNLDSAFAYLNTRNILNEKPAFFNRKSSIIKRQVEYQEVENHILKHNIEVTREKLFHLIAQMNWRKLSDRKFEQSDNDLYQDIFCSLALMQQKLLGTWNLYQDKIWQLSNNREKALRNQLDPHFIFNVLNAIRQVILDKDHERAGELLNDFADFMRILLRMGFDNSVSLATEIEYLSLYVKMEMFRFEDQFDFNLDIAPEIQDNLGDIHLPPLIIQPYLEQAIWERVLPAQKRLLLNLAFRIEEGNLICVITENGLSFTEAHYKFRDFAQDRQQRLDSLRARLELLDEMHTCKIEVIQHEITNSSSDKVTSEVVIHIPQECF